MLPIIPNDSFCWQRWRNVNIYEMFGIACRTYDLVNSKHILKKYAIGYIDASKLLCRPKLNNKAVMFLKDDEFFWFHLRNNEFLFIFENN